MASTPHRDTHVAAALDPVGGVLATASFPATAAGYRDLLAWLRSFGEVDAYLPDLAMSVNNLADRLGKVGRRGEGPTAAQEAVDLYRELAQSEPELDGPAAE